MKKLELFILITVVVILFSVTNFKSLASSIQENEDLHLSNLINIAFAECENPYVIGPDQSEDDWDDFVEAYHDHGYETWTSGGCDCHNEWDNQECEYEPNSTCTQICYFYAECS
jgi:hypothetical protein